METKPGISNSVVDKSEMGSGLTKEQVDLWKTEESLSLDERRERYRCGDSYQSVETLERWVDSVEDSIEFSVKREPIRARSLLLERKVIELIGDYGNDQGNKGDIGRYALLKKKSDSEDEAEIVPFGNFKGNEGLNKKLCLLRADITTLELDAIVNAANESLKGGGGIDGAIHRAAGDLLYEECCLLNGARVGQTKTTRGYNLPSRLVMHTVGPRGEQPDLLKDCYKSIFSQVLKFKSRTFALCGISTGIFGYPLYSASNVALHSLRTWLQSNQKKVDLIVICTFLEKELDCYRKLTPLYFPPAGMTTKDVLSKYQAGFDEWDEDGDDSFESDVATEVTERKKRIDREKKEKEEREKRWREMRKQREEKEAQEKEKEERGEKSQEKSEAIGEKSKPKQQIDEANEGKSEELGEKKSKTKEQIDEANEGKSEEIGESKNTKGNKKGEAKESEEEDTKPEEEDTKQEEEDTKQEEEDTKQEEEEE